MNHVADGVWITDIDTIAEQPTDRFDTVVSVCQDVTTENISAQKEYLHFPLADDLESKRNWGGTIDYETFEEAADNVRQRIERYYTKRSILVHCHKGRNRSAAVITAALAVYRDITYETAFDMVAEARPIALPNNLMEAHARQYIDAHN